MSITATMLILHKKDMNEPSIVFPLSFDLACLVAILNIKQFELHLHLNTFLVIIFGVINFCIVSSIVKSLSKKKISKNNNELKPIHVEKTKILLYIVFSSLVGILYFIYVVKSVGGSFGSIAAISKAIGTYNDIVKFNEGALSSRIPSLFLLLKDIVLYSAYWFMYVIINNYVLNKKVDLLLALELIICLLLSLLSGSRAPAFNIILAGLSFYLFFNKKKNGEKLKLSFKEKKRIITIIAAMILVFFPLANLLGRTTKKDFSSYISIYCGAEIKNLDTFLQKDSVIEEKAWGSQTFYGLYSSFGKYLNIPKAKYQLNLPFNYVGIRSLGNVYTIFYPFIYDFGYIGLFIMVTIMAIISQLIYNKANNSKIREEPNIYVLLYGFIFSCLILSFFSNKFYERVFSIGLIKAIFVWLSCNLFFSRIRFISKRTIIEKEK